MGLIKKKSVKEEQAAATEAPPPSEEVELLDENFLPIEKPKVEEPEPVPIVDYCVNYLAEPDAFY